MMHYLIDSDIIIDFLNRKENAVALFSEENVTKIFYLSIISWLEIMYGFKKNLSLKKTQLFTDFLSSFNIEILPIDKKVAGKYLDLKLDLEDKNEPLADFDLFIASTALVHKLILLTRNKKHFSRINHLQLK